MFKTLLLVVTLSIFFPITTLADAPAESPVSILYHEPLVLLEHDRVDGLSNERQHFDAFGRRFELEITEPIQFGATADVQVLRGILNSTPGSWFRLTRRFAVNGTDELRGILHDATDTYIIEPRSASAANLIGSYSSENDVNIIYRLADTLVQPGLLSCPTYENGNTHEPVNAKTAFAELTAELDSNAGPQSDDDGTGDVASIGVLTDASFRAAQYDESSFVVESMFAIVDGIYSSQLGVKIDPVEILDLPDGIGSPISTTRNGETLLAEISTWRQNNQTQYAITHLLTDRRLQNGVGGTIAGISYLGTPGRNGVCNARNAVSITEWIGSLTSLVIAHEIAHNFGASHDGEPSADSSRPAACRDTQSDQFLMSAMLRSANNDQFSACSLAEMRRVIAAAACLRPESVAAFAAEDESNGGGGAVHWLATIALIGVGAIRRRTRKIAL